MSAARVRTAVVIGIVSGFLLGCDDDTVTANRDAATQLSVNPSFTIVDAADTSLIRAVAQNRAGEATYDPVQFAACDTKIVAVEDPSRIELEPPTRILVIGQTLGASCVDVTGPGSLTATATVNVVPAALALSLPADTIESGQAAQANLTYLDAAGAPVSGFDLTQVEFSILAPAVADVDAAALLAGKSPGTTFIKAALLSSWGAPRVDSIPFTVIATAFTGTASSNSGNSGDFVTYTVGGGQPDWDDDTSVEIGGLLSFTLSGSTVTDLVTAIPWGIPAGPNDVLFTGVGPDQLGLLTSFDVAALAANDDHEPNNVLDGDLATLVTLPYEDVNVVDGTDLDDFFQITLATQTTLHLFLDWDDGINGDMDLLVTDLATDEVCGFVTATGDHPEEGECTLDPGTYYLWVNNFAEAGLTNYHILVEPVAP